MKTTNSINEKILKKLREKNPLSEIEIAFPYINNNTVILYQMTDFGPFVIFTNKDASDSRILYYNNIENKFMLSGDDPDYFSDYGESINLNIPFISENKLLLASFAELAVRRSKMNRPKSVKRCKTNFGYLSNSNLQHACKWLVEEEIKFNKKFNNK